MAGTSATYKYWDAMASVRDRAPIATGVSTKVQKCSVDLSGSDATYASRCAAAWLEVNAAPSRYSVQQVFARDYFKWCQQYLKEALSKKSLATTDSTGRVVWTLDVWAYVNYALFALNIAWGEVFRRDFQGHLPFTPSIYGKLKAARDQELRWVESSRQLMVDSYASASLQSTRDAAAKAKLQPMPFAELAVEWCGESRALYARKANPLWAALLDAVRPWSRDWGQHWLGSKGDKDAAELKLATGDAPLSVALMQWRMWSVQDFSTDKGATSAIRATRTTSWPIFMGTRFDCVTLFHYLRSVATERATPEVVYQNGRAYPNLAHGTSLVAAYAQVIAAADFDLEVTDYFGRYLKRYPMPFKSDGTLMTKGEVQDAGGPPASYGGIPDDRERPKPAQIPITFDDYRQWLKDLSKLNFDPKKIGTYDESQCGDDSACRTAVKAQRAAFNKTPLGPVLKNMVKGAQTLLKLVGAGGAIGGGEAPVYGVPNPFARSFADDQYKTAMVGNTIVALSRLPQAVLNLEKLEPGLFTTLGATTTAFTPRNCTVYFDANDTPHEVCADDAGGSGGSQQTQHITHSDQEMQCHLQWVQFLHENPAAAKCFPLAGDPLFKSLCAEVHAKTRTVDSAYAQWIRYAASKCPELRPRTMLQMFGRNLIHAGSLGIF